MFILFLPHPDWNKLNSFGHSIEIRFPDDEPKCYIAIKYSYRFFTEKEAIKYFEEIIDSKRAHYQNEDWCMGFPDGSVRYINWGNHYLKCDFRIENGNLRSEMLDIYYKKKFRMEKLWYIENEHDPLFSYAHSSKELIHFLEKIQKD